MINVEEIAEDDEIEVDEEAETNEKELVALKRSERIKVSRVGCNKGQEKSVNKMMQINKKINKYDVPDVQRGPLNQSNLLCYVLEEKNSLFKLGSRAGVLDNSAFNAFVGVRVRRRILLAV